MAPEKGIFERYVSQVCPVEPDERAVDFLLKISVGKGPDYPVREKKHDISNSFCEKKVQRSTRQGRAVSVIGTSERRREQREDRDFSTGKTGIEGGWNVRGQENRTKIRPGERYPESVTGPDGEGKTDPSFAGPPHPFVSGGTANKRGGGKIPTDISSDIAKDLI